MSSLTITTRQAKDGPRYAVRYRLGGRAYPIVHGGSFRTLREAKVRRDFIAGEIAAGRNPADALAALAAAPAPTLTLGGWAERYLASRVDLAAQTLRAMHSHVDALGSLAELDPQAIAAADVQEWLAGLKMKPASVARYLQTLRGLFDFIGLDPNVARDARVRLPREERRLVEPPTAADVETIITTTPKRWRLPLRVLAETGLRVGELHNLEWRDVDERGSRLRIRGGKTRAARRWVAIPGSLMETIAATCPREDRTAERRVFPGCSPGAVRAAMARACNTAGIALYSPHDLRHRWASVQVARGVPLPQVAEALGHSRSSLTLDVYSHVVTD